jgi:hypothetical protein
MATTKFTVNSGSISQINNVEDNNVEFKIELNAKGAEEDKHPSAEKSYRFVEWLKTFFPQKTIFFWISGFSFLLSIIAICGAFVCKNTVLVDESIVLILVGILATFIVVGNYAQVKDVKDEFDRQVTGIKDSFTTQIIDVETKHKKIIRAMSEYELGRSSSDKSISLLFYMRSLELLNEVHDDDITDIVIRSIDVLKFINEAYKDNEEKRIQLSGRNKTEYVKILHVSKHKLSGDLIKWIESIPESWFSNVVDDVVNGQNNQ